MLQHRSASVGELYATANANAEVGVEGYRAPRAYFDAQLEAQLREQAKIKKGGKDRRYKTKRGSFLDDETKLHKSVPGPGQYPSQSLWPGKPSLKVKLPDRKTFVDEIFRRSKRFKTPSPGQYHTFLSQKEIEAEKKRLANRKTTYKQRTTFLDDTQIRSTQQPGAGNYNLNFKQRVRTEHSRLRTKPQEWRKKHLQQSKKKPPKSPGLTSYTPLPMHLTLFEHLKKMKASKYGLGKMERFRTSVSGSGLPPAKYSILQKWPSKEKKKIERHGFEALSRTTSKSIYH